MDSDLEDLVIRVRADTSGFLAGVVGMRRELDGPLALGVERAGGSIERSLSRAVASGRLGFEDLRRVALRSLADIAEGALRSDFAGLLGGGGGTGLLGQLGSLLGGAPGRATGGPVTAGRAYRVGERGPELFVPQAAGRIETDGQNVRGPVQVTVNVAAPPDAGPAMMAQTGAQVARAVRRALMRAEA